MADMHRGEEGEPDPDPGPDWAPGKFQIGIISMGQGDCCLITCPNGEHIMVDCGSKSFETVGMPWVYEIVRGPWFLDRPETKRMRLSAVILTHPDEDHINKINYMLGQSPEGDAIPVTEVYFSDVNTARTDYLSGPLGVYRAGDCGNTLIDYCKVRALYRVTLNAEAETLETWNPPFGVKQWSTENILIDEKRVRVCGGEYPEDDDDDDEVERTEWEVSIIAGNVARIRGDYSDKKNAASLVTLVRFGTEKALICGDASRSTQDYLYNTFQNTNDINNLQVFHVPHHGSSLNAPTPELVKLLQPKFVVISVKSDEHTHHLPGSNVIESYLKYAAASLKPHSSRSWKPMADAEFQELRLDWERRKGTSINYEQNHEKGVRRYTRAKSETGDGYEGAVILDGVGAPASETKYVLYQRQIQRQIKQTGLDENQWYYLPE